jgi:hypothetical protein
MILLIVHSNGLAGLKNTPADVPKFPNVNEDGRLKMDAEMNPEL